MRKGNIFVPRNLRTGILANSQLHTMKEKNIISLWVLVTLISFAFATNATAQDDLYYDPSTDANTTAPTYSNDYTEENNVTRRYDDDAYYEDDDYAYEYSSRIRRFHRPARVVDYYDPFFVDMYYYDPFYSPGASIYVYNYNDYWSYRRWRRMNRWNSWNAYNYGYGFGWNSWGWNSCYSGYSPYYNPWVANNYYYDPYWTHNGYNPYYGNYGNYGNNWVNNNYYYNNGSNGSDGGYSPQTYTGTRRHGSRVNPGYARLNDGNGRLSTTQANVPVVAKSARVGRTGGDFEPATSVKPATRATAPANAKGSRLGNEPNSTVRGTESPRNVERADKPANTRNPEVSPRRPAEPATRTQETTPSRRSEPATRKDNGYKPSPSNERKAPVRTSEPRPKRRKDDGYNAGRSATPRQETRPARRSESAPQRSVSPSRSSSPSRTESSRPSRSSTPSSTRSSSGGGSSSKSSGRSSSGGSKSGKSGRGN